MDNRLELHTYLKSVCPNVYFQPPSNITMVFPCIVYSRIGIDFNMASNSQYSKDTSYSLIVIGAKCDNTYIAIVNKLLEELQYIQYENEYVSDNLYHTVLKTYF